MSQSTTKQNNKIKNPNAYWALDPLRRHPWEFPKNKRMPFWKKKFKD